MPRAKRDDAKTSTELEDEIKEMQKTIAAKKKAAKLAKQKEDREAEQAREYEENKFNREFVEMAKQVRICDCVDYAEKTIYETIKQLMAKRDQRSDE